MAWNPEKRQDYTSRELRSGHLQKECAGLWAARTWPKGSQDLESKWQLTAEMKQLKSGRYNLRPNPKQSQKRKWCENKQHHSIQCKTYNLVLQSNKKASMYSNIIWNSTVISLCLACILLVMQLHSQDHLHLAKYCLHRYNLSILLDIECDLCGFCDSRSGPLQTLCSHQSPRVGVPGEACHGRVVGERHGRLGGCLSCWLATEVGMKCHRHRWWGRGQSSVAAAS